ncbi:hypothetical protein [Celeribacter halophilus]|uniref:hypothetical protein n=1 Tax=Celeribacter halophilus TaxID=576117 RepID=UPI003A8F4528
MVTKMVRPSSYERIGVYERLGNQTLDVENGEGRRRALWQAYQSALDANSNARWQHLRTIDFWRFLGGRCGLYDLSAHEAVFDRDIAEHECICIFRVYLAGFRGAGNNTSIHETDHEPMS